MPKSRSVVFAALILILCSCSYSNSKTPGTESQPGTANPPPAPEATPQGTSAPTYEQVKAQVLDRECVSCHGNEGGVNLETYANVKANLDRIQQAALVNKIMPPGHPLDAQEADLLSKWIAAGAPEGPVNP